MISPTFTIQDIGNGYAKTTVAFHHAGHVCEASTVFKRGTLELHNLSPGRVRVLDQNGIDDPLPPWTLANLKSVEGNVMSIEGKTNTRQPPKFPANTRIRIREGCENAGRTGVAFATFTLEGGNTWIGVIWDDSNGDPDWHKESALEEAPLARHETPVLLYVLVWNTRDSDQYNPLFDPVVAMTLPYVLDHLELVAAHTQDELLGKNVAKIFPGQEDHPLYADAECRRQSRFGGTPMRME